MNVPFRTKAHRSRAVARLRWARTMLDLVVVVVLLLCAVALVAATSCRTSPADAPDVADAAAVADGGDAPVFESRRTTFAQCPEGWRSFRGSCWIEDEAALPLFDGDVCDPDVWVLAFAPGRRAGEVSRFWRIDRARVGCRR